MAPSPYDLSCWWDVKHKRNNNIIVLYSLDPDQVGHFFWSDLDQICLQRLSADNTYKVSLTPLKYHIFENIMENEAFALLEQMRDFP